MKTFIIYLVLFAFYFLSLTPAGLSMQQVMAFDDFGFDDDLDSMFDDPPPSGRDSSESSFGFDDPPPSTSPSFSSSYGTRIAAFYLYADSYSESKAGSLTAETASYLATLGDYDYVRNEASLFVPTISAAQRDFDRGTDLFKEAKELYEDLLIEEAISKFKQALVIFERNLDKLPELKMISDTLLYLGASYRMLDEDEQAIPYFNSYVSLNPIAELDDIVFSPEIVSFYNRIRDDHLMLPTGTAIIDSFPTGALVFINGKVAGTTPLRLDGLTGGSHYYRIHKTGYRSRAGTIQIRERRDTRIREDLQGYSEASFIEKSKDIMIADYGRLTMLRAALDLAEKLNVEEVAVTMVSVQDETVKYSGHIVNKEKRSFKKSETQFEMPFDGNMGRVYEVETFHSELFRDKFGYRPVSDVALDEAQLLGLSDGKKGREDKPKREGGGSKWWLWTILGVVVLGGAGVGTYFIVTETGKSKGAELEINF
jgi:tetratricopeptide (TPR) repeat protein